MSDDLVTWLRAVIGKRLALARHVISVQAEVESGIVMVPAEAPPASPRWHEQSSGILWTGEGGGDAWHGTWAMGDSRLTRFIADNDPEAVIGQCEAELAILDLYERTAARVTTPPTVTAVRWPGAEPQPGMISTRDYQDAKRELAVLGPVIRMLAHGYRHRDGYREEWAP